MGYAKEHVLTLCLHQRRTNMLLALSQVQANYAMQGRKRPDDFRRGEPVQSLIQRHL